MNLSFLNPSLLWLLPASLLPVILHLFFRKKYARVVFSDIRLIRLAVKNVLPRTKLQQWLLLFLRCLILLLLLLIAARPVGYSGAPGGKGKTRQIMVLLDSSYSMLYEESGIKRFDGAKDFAGRLSDELFSRKDGGMNTEHRQVNAAVFSDCIEGNLPGFSNDADYVRRFISGASCGYRAGDLAPGLSYCYRAFSRMPAGDRTAIIISDLCSHIIPGSSAGGDLRKTIPEYDPAVKLIFIGVNNGAGENTCVGEVRVEENPLRAVASIGNFSRQRNKCPLLLKIEGKPVSSELADLPRDKASEYEFDFSAGAGLPSLTGFVESQEDNLGADDRGYFVYTPETGVPLLIVDGDPKFGNAIGGESYYLEAAFEERGAGLPVPADKSGGKSAGAVRGRFGAEIIDGKEFGGADLGKYGLIFICNAERFPREILSGLSGKSVVITLGDKYAPENYPDELAGSIGAGEEGKFKLKIPEGGENSSPGAGFLPRAGEFELDKIVFDRRFRLSGGNPLVNFSDGQPLLIEKDIGGNRVFIFASSIDYDWTNFPTKPFYPYFIRSLAEYCAGAEETAGQTAKLFVGEPLRRAFKGSGGSGSAVLTFPDGSQKSVRADVDGEFSRVVYEGTDVPGIYRLEAGKKTAYFAVNVDTRRGESNLARVEQSKLKKLLPGAPVWVLGSDRAAVKSTAALIEGKGLSKLFLTLVLLFLGLELILANRKL
jgi:hypothetical protein